MKWIMNFSAIARSLWGNRPSATLPVYRSIAELVHYPPSSSGWDKKREEWYHINKSGDNTAYVLLAVS